MKRIVIICALAFSAPIAVGAAPIYTFFATATSDQSLPYNWPGFQFDFEDLDGNGRASLNEVVEFVPISRLVVGLSTFEELVFLGNSAWTAGGRNPRSGCNGLNNPNGTSKTGNGSLVIGFRTNTGSNWCFRESGVFSFSSTAPMGGTGSGSTGGVSPVPLPAPALGLMAALGALFGFRRKG